MALENRFGATSSESGTAGDTLRLQREINEELVVSALRARDQADDAALAQRLAEREAEGLRRIGTELRATAELRERLIGIIGHDLRTPLSAIIMAANRLLARGNLSLEDARPTQLIVTSAQRMNRMIGLLVDFTRARLGGGFPLKPEESDFGQICHSVAEELRVARNADVRVAVVGDLTGVWDRDRLVQALSNIAGNAVDYADAGTPVWIRAADEGSAISVAVSNLGPCIPPELLAVLFKPFRGSQSDTRRSSGHLGLGLYVACEIARAHGGSLVADSADNCTTFTLRVPRRQAGAR